MVRFDCFSGKYSRLRSLIPFPFWNWYWSVLSCQLGIPVKLKITVIQRWKLNYVHNDPINLRFVQDVCITLMITGSWNHKSGKLCNKCQRKKERKEYIPSNYSSLSRFYKNSRANFESCRSKINSVKLILNNLWENSECNFIYIISRAVVIYIHVIWRIRTYCMYM